MKYTHLKHHLANIAVFYGYRAGKIRFSGTQKSVLLKASSVEHCAPHNFALLVTLGSLCVHLIVYLAVYQMK